MSDQRLHFSDEELDDLDIALRITEGQLSELRGKLELSEARLEACRLYSGGFARRIRELTEENAQLTEIIEEARREFSWYEEQKGLYKYTVSEEWLDDLTAILDRAVNA